LRPAPPGGYSAPMLGINDVTYRIGGRTLLDHATATLPASSRVGLVGRNGAGKTTLFRIITGEITPELGEVKLPPRARIGRLAQEAPDGPEHLIEVVLAADRERTQLLAEAETEREPSRIAEIQTRLADIGAYSAPARAAEILAGLGFSHAEQQRSCQEFSGGWRMRVALAAALFAEPDLLLLDEPTNYLDLEATLWLEQHIARYPHSVIVISHDRDLLDNAVDWTLHLAAGKLTLYRGGYSQFERARRERQALDLKLAKKQETERKRLTAFVERFRAKATKARQAQSRLKLLAKLQPIDVRIEDEVRAIAIPSPEKPLSPPSNYAVTGIYFYDGRASAFAKALAPSPRGELEITDLNRAYLKIGELHVERLGRGTAWLDTGTHNSLLDAGVFVRIIEERQGLKVACVEEIAWRSGFISADQLVTLAKPLEKSGYGEYLLRIVNEHSQL